VIHLRPRNAALGLATTPATIMLFDRDTGAPRCVLAGTYLTALRTAASSALATAALAPQLPRMQLVIFGAGLQAETHAKCICAVRSVGAIVLVNRSPERAQALAGELRAELQVPIRVVASDDVALVRAAVGAADIVCTTTGSASPLFEAAWLRRGAHVNAVGSYVPSTSELDPLVAKRARRLVVDTDDAWSAGDLGRPLELGYVRKEDSVTLGQLCLGELSEAALLATLQISPAHEGQERVSQHEPPPPPPQTADVQASEQDKDITLFKSVGTAVLDIAAALLVYQECTSAGLGAVRVDMN
jgi:ornithine cyclodeaminase